MLPRKGQNVTQREDEPRNIRMCFGGMAMDEIKGSQLGIAIKLKQRV